MKLTKLAKSRVRHHKAHPRKVVMEVRRLLLQTPRAATVARLTGVDRNTIRRWNQEYGWGVKLKAGGPTGGQNADPLAPETPKTWRCVCGRLNDQTPCQSCGVNPAWAA